MIGFVDDKRHYVNLPEMIIGKSLIKSMEPYISSWYEVLHFCGVELK